MAVEETGWCPVAGDRISVASSIDGDDLSGSIPQAGSGALRRENDRSVGVFDHQRDAFRGVAGIHRNVSPARLQDRQQPDHHFDGSFDGDANQCLGVNADLLQMPRQLIGALVEFAIGQAAPCRNHRDRIRRARNLLLEQLRNRALARVVRVGLVAISYFCGQQVDSPEKEIQCPCPGKSQWLPLAYSRWAALSH